MRSFCLFICLFAISFSVMAQKKWHAAEDDSLNNARLLYEEGNFDLAIPILETLYQKHKTEFFLKYLYGQCALHRADKHATALELLTQVFNVNRDAGDIELALAQAMHYNYKFDSALIVIDLYLGKKNLSPEKIKIASQTKKYIINASYLVAHPTNAKISNMGTTINTENDEYVPVIAADESIIIFTYKGNDSKGGRQNAYQEADKRGKFYEDVFVSEKINGNWIKPNGIDAINTAIHDAAIAISPDGTQLFTYINDGENHGDIGISYLKGKEWSQPTKLKGLVNSKWWEGSCSLSPNGQTLFFSSDREGGYGGRDLYKATLLQDSTWGNVVNLGDSVNTIYDDDAPFIHSDGVTLLFSSKGRNSMGDYDIFQTIMNPIDSTFSSPLNLGYPINTPYSDRYFVVAGNAETGFYSSEKSGGNGLNDIYSVTPGYIGKKPSVYLVKGKVTLKGSPVDSRIEVKIVSKNNKFFTAVIPNSATGKYLLTLPSGEIFDLLFILKSKYNRTIQIDASNTSGYFEKDMDIEFDSATVAILNKSLMQLNIKKDSTLKNSTVAKIDSISTSKKVLTKNSIDCLSSLKYKVQVAAVKFPKKYPVKQLKKFGKIDYLMLEDGITRITIGGIFVTIEEATNYCNKLKSEGVVDAFVTAVCDKKRLYLEEIKKSK